MCPGGGGQPGSEIGSSEGTGFKFKTSLWTPDPLPYFCSTPAQSQCQTPRTWLKAERSPVWSENSSARGSQRWKEAPSQTAPYHLPRCEQSGSLGESGGALGVLGGLCGQGGTQEGSWGIWGPVRGFAISVASGALVVWGTSGSLGGLGESGGTQEV